MLKTATFQKPVTADNATGRRSWDNVICTSFVPSIAGLKPDNTHGCGGGGGGGRGGVLRHICPPFCHFICQFAPLAEYFVTVGVLYHTGRLISSACTQAMYPKLATVSLDDAHLACACRSLS